MRRLYILLVALIFLIFVTQAFAQRCPSPCPNGKCPTPAAIQVDDQGCMVLQYHVLHPCPTGHCRPVMCYLRTHKPLRRVLVAPIKFVKNRQPVRSAVRFFRERKPVRKFIFRRRFCRRC